MDIPFFNRLKLRHKLFFLISLPLVLVLGYSYVLCQERYNDLNNAQDIVDIAKTTELLRLVHWLQYERGKSLLYSVDKSPQNLNNLHDALKHSLHFEAALPQLKAKLKANNTNPLVIEILSNVEEKINSLNEIREHIKEGTVLTGEFVFQTYSHAIEEIHYTINTILALAPDTTVYQLTESLMIITELKEVLSKRRDWVAYILERGEIQSDDISTIIRLSTHSKLLDGEFFKLAPKNFQNKYIELGINTSGKTENITIKQILHSETTSEVIYDPIKWFNNESKQTDNLYQLELSFDSAILDYSQKNSHDAYLALFITAAFAIIIIGLVLAIALIAINKLSAGFILLRNSAVALTQSGELKSIAIHSEDELGDLAKAFDQLIKKLIHISCSVEAVASGDYKQEVEVKSDKDRFALSLNHMFRTLQESVERLHYENWLKTGEGELVMQINNNQGVEDLAQKTINYICSYVKATVGAIYLVDNEGTAELYASYAHTFRKGDHHHFVKGQSLVGQTVRERKPIIIEQLPSNYISVGSGLGNTVPNSLVVWPFVFSEQVLGVIELGTFDNATNHTIDLLGKISENIAISLHAAQGRQQLSQLLKQSQEQSEKLQAQHEELEQTNIELEKQTKEMEEAQIELSQQKQQLIDANTELTQNSNELSLRNEEIESRSKELEKSQWELEIKAEALSNASKYKSEFLANMSHELRSPLNSLLLLAQTLKENDENNLTITQLESMDIIYNSGRDLLDLINDILDLSKVEAGKLNIELSSCNLRDMSTSLEKQFQPLANNKSLNFSIKIDSNTPKNITTDQNRLQQILRNLLENAFKFTEKGQIHVNISSDSKGNINFIVKDSGVGIPSNLQKDIFEAFQQVDGSIKRKYSGTGLGLTISRKLAQLLGGDISLLSEEDKGTTFTLQLPVQATTTVSQVSSFETNPLHSVPANCEQTPICIDDYKNTQISEIKQFMSDDRFILQDNKNLLLIIEDDLSFSRTLVDLAHASQFQTIVAGDVKSGIQMALHFKPQAIILDILLPDGSGNDIIYHLNTITETKSIPVHIISSIDKECLDQNNTIGVATKPVSKESINNIFDTILHHLHEKRQLRVLMIEDDVNTHFAIEKLLSEQNVNILHATTGEQGLKIYQQEKLDCIILDLTLPDMDSLEVLKNITEKQDGHTPPIVIYTGKDLSHDQYKQLRQYTDHIIIKGSLAQERLFNDVTQFLVNLQPKINVNKTKNIGSIDASLKGKKVLIVDDDMRNTFALANIFRRQGMKVVMADNGHLALEKLNECNDIEIAIMDIMMPVMDGYETISQIRKNSEYSELPIIALTAKAMAEDKDKCLKIGANDYLSKPVDADLLLSTVKEWANAS